MRQHWTSGIVDMTAVVVIILVAVVNAVAGAVGIQHVEGLIHGI